ncbi:MAG: GAF domain-containing protein, partial [Planctomycetota bacterium]|nr:GAF domain-containing protein [Planctomycetota bacterium]
EDGRGAGPAGGSRAGGGRVTRPTGKAAEYHTLLAADLLSEEMDLPSVVARVAAENKRMQTLLQIGQRMTSELDLAVLLDFIVDTAVEMLKAENGFIILVDTRGVSSVHVARRFDKAEMRSPELQFSHSIAEEVARTGRPIITGDARADTRFNASDSVRNLAISSVMCVPMRAKDRTIGALYVENRRVADAFSDDDNDLMQAFGDHAAIAIENARLMDENEKKHDELAESQRQVVVLNAQLRDLNRRLAVQLEDKTVELDAVKTL